MTKVFISSTSKDLVKYREAAVSTCLRLGFFPIDMKDFPAMGVGATEGSKRMVDEGDLYVGIFAHRYGYIEAGYDKSVTEIEFDYAGERKLERLCFLVDESYPWPRAADDDNPEYALKLKAFKNGINRSLIRGEFTTIDDLTNKLIFALIEWRKQHPEAEPALKEPDVPISAAATLVRDPDDLPRRPPKHFVGRANLLDEVSVALEHGENVLLQGFRGMGKTSLAATVGAQWVEQNKGAVLWLTAGTTAVEGLYEALARCLDQNKVAEILRATETDKKQIVRQLLRASEAKLLIVDDCWNDAALFRLVDAIPSNLPVLVTSNLHIPLEGLIKNISGLQPVEALDLLRYHAGTIDSTDPQAAALCERLGYHTFAVEIAGKVLKAQNLPPGELLARINENPHDLEVPGSFSENERRSVKDLLDASLKALDERTQMLFRACGAFFVPRVTKAMLQYYRGKGIAIDKNLETLQQHGLLDYVQPASDSHGYYRLHVLAYSYARAKTNSGQRERALRACLDYVKPYDRPSAKSFSAILPELDNLIGAADDAFERKSYIDMERLINNLVAGSQILDLLGYLTDSIRLLEKAVEGATRRQDQQARSVHLGNLGNAYGNLMQFETAIDYHQQVLVISRNIRDREAEGTVLGNLGNAYSDLGQIETAIDHFQQALVISREIHDRRGEGSWMGSMGNSYSILGQTNTSIDYHQQALAISREIHDRRAEGKILGNLGNTYRDLGQIKTAIDYHQQALAISRELRDRRGESKDLGNLGNAYSDLKEIETAIEHYQQALAISREIKDRSGEGRIISNIGNIYYELGQIETAIEHYQQALAISREIKDRSGEGNRLGNLGSSYSTLGKVETAIDYYQQALTISRYMKDRRGEGSYLGNLGSSYSTLGKVETAIDYYQQALSIAREIKDRSGEGNYLGNLGYVYNQSGQYEKALELLNQALEIRREIKDRSGEGIDLGNMGDAYSGIKNYPRAFDYYKQALAITREVKDPQAEATWLSHIGNAYRDTGEYDLAFDHYNQSRTIFTEINNPYEIGKLDKEVAEAERLRAEADGEPPVS